MKVETIENEKKRSEWPVPCLVIDEYGTIVLVTSIRPYTEGYYDGTVVKENNGWEVGAPIEEIHPKDGWTLYDGKVILSNN